MNFSEKVAEINGKVKSYKLEIEGVEKIPADEMVRVLWLSIWKMDLFFPFP